ncbi:hypothetical protein BASA81_001180 [Batrachochytrium salamandrivorans]|nr:hypothetical protein BASA81_001180 [Batrachochytrium salamandrivorans]
MRLWWLLILNLVHAKSLGGWGEFFLVLQSDGQVFSLGKNSFGQLGLGRYSTAEYFPTQMKNVVFAVDVAAATQHSCIVEQAGRVRCTGKDNYGQLGDGTKVEKTVLSNVVESPGFLTASRVFLGPASSCALFSTGAVKCWGYNTGNLGDGTMNSRTAPSSVVGFALSGAQDVAVGPTHTCFLATTGFVWCTGYNIFGQLGDGTKNSYLSPVRIAGPARDLLFTSVAAGNSHSCACNAAVVYCWGAGMYGQLGSGNLENSLLPIRVNALASPPNRVWASAYTSFVFINVSTVAGFGENSNGALGNGNNAYQNLPVLFNQGPAATLVEVAGGYPTTCVLDINRAVYCVGTNGGGQMGVGPQISNSLTVLKMQSQQSMPTNPPTNAPTKKPTRAPTKKPTKVVTNAPTKRPTLQPTPKQPTRAPTKRPTTLAPTRRPTKAPTKRPTAAVTSAPTKRPTLAPSPKQPTSAPTKKPTTSAPIKRPTKAPTKRPTKVVTSAPTKRPTKAPTKRPSRVPTVPPTKRPTKAPTARPTKRPTKKPTKKGETLQPTLVPTTFVPTLMPTTLAPSLQPSLRPTQAPTLVPTAQPTLAPTFVPTHAPTLQPTFAPTLVPTLAPTGLPTLAPTGQPTLAPTGQPTLAPTDEPTFTPTGQPTLEPTTQPTQEPTSEPTLAPTG